MTGSPPTALPIDTLRGEVGESLAAGPLVITAPTGTGKSTQVPRWLKGRVLVIQPRRVAARNVAARIAELEGAALGEEVGYRVRDEDRSSAGTRILVVTPGIVLNQPGLLDEFDATIVDEVHERRLDTDLILALALHKGTPLLAMSATVQGDQVAEYLGGRHLSVKARTYPVEVRYADVGDQPPRLDQLAERVRKALEEISDLPGDVLVFLPGKAEIRATLAELSGLVAKGMPLDIRELHGGLTLARQAEALRRTEGAEKQRRVIVTTNVAETSLTVPGVCVVVDSGLVRRTSYHEGRSYLGVGPIATDSAQQRAGRAGRTAPGICVRLWSPTFRLETETPPEIKRESLSPLLLAIGSLGLRPQELRFLDAPTTFALEAAQEDLSSLGATDAQGHLTALGRELARLPVLPWFARILVAAREEECLDSAIDLVAALEQGRADLLPEAVPDERLERPDCDLLALVTAVREPQWLTGQARQVAEQARESRRRLRRALSVNGDAEPLKRERLLLAILRADPRAGCVRRKRKARDYFSSGGTEMELSRSSRVGSALEQARESSREELSALVVLGTRAQQRGARMRSISITAAAPVPLSLLAKANLGELRVARAQLKAGRILTTSERTWAGRVIETRETSPKGVLARQAIGQLYLQGSLFRPQKEEALRRLSRRALAARLGRHPEFPFFKDCQAPPTLEDWLSTHLEELGVESTDDLSLLSPEDFLPEDVPAELKPTLEDRFPLEVDVGDCVYRAEYDLEKRQVLLTAIRGGRKTPPPAGYLPRFEGLRVYAEAGGSFHLVRRG